VLVTGDGFVLANWFTEYSQHIVAKNYTIPTENTFLRLSGRRWRHSNPPPTWKARSPYICPPGTGWSSPKSKSKVKCQSHVTTDGQSISMSWSLVHSALQGLYLNEFQSNIKKGTLRRNFNFFYFLLFTYCFFTIYSRYLKRVISKRDGCEYLKQVPSIDGSLELI
jgi:hypothetical protein